MQQQKLQTTKPGDGARLREIRQRLGVLQVELAAKSGVALSLVNRVERWGVPIRRETAKRLARALGVPLAEAFPSFAIGARS